MQSAPQSAGGEGNRGDSLDLLASLLIAAQEDAALRSQILHLCALPTLQRESMVNTALHEMALRGESAAARAAFATLASERGAKVAGLVLRLRSA